MGKKTHRIAPCRPRWPVGIALPPTPTSDASNLHHELTCGIRGPENGCRNEAALSLVNAASAAFGPPDLGGGQGSQRSG